MKSKKKEEGCEEQGTEEVYGVQEWPQVATLTFAGESQPYNGGSHISRTDLLGLYDHFTDTVTVIQVLVGPHDGAEHSERVRGLVHSPDILITIKE
jgi:hypothetical protein